jgi:FMN phosphatase YigB (HAD superfamily)
MSTTIKTIILDFGNVLGYFDHQITWNKVAPHSKLSLQQLLAAIAAGNLEDDYESGRMTSDEFLARLLDIGEFQCGTDFLSTAWKDIFWPNPDVCRLIPRLKSRFRIQLGSNTNDLHAEQFLAQFSDVLAHFDALTLSHKVGARKPRAEFFADCHQKAGCAPQECLFIDDLPANLQGAKAYGFHAIHYTGEGSLRAPLAAHGIAL